MNKELTEELLEELLDGDVNTVPVSDPQNVAALHDFYDYSKKEGIRLDKLRIIRLLRRLGYLRYDTPEGAMMFVHVKDRKLRIVNQTQIIDAFEDYINSLPDRVIKQLDSMPKEGDGDAPVEEDRITKKRILTVFYQSDMKRYFGILDRLRPESPIELMTDTKETKYYYFNNICIAVGKRGWRPVAYDSDELKGYIWESNIIDRAFTYTDNVGDFERFCRNVARDAADPSNTSRFFALQSILGYLTHDFYEIDLKAVFLTDVNKEQAGKAAGRTGKGLLGKACAQVLNRKKNDTKYVAIPGKGFDHNTGNGTCYSLADVSTQLIHIEDIDARHFSFEDLYNDVTDGAKIRKNYDRYPIIKYVKFLLSSNQTINLSGSSSRGRVCMFELSNYYSDTHRPSDDFKKRFFESEWTEQDWNEFYSFMIRCTVEYFKNGLQEPDELFYNKRRAVESMGREIVDFIEEVMRLYSTFKAMSRTVISKPDLLLSYQTTRDKFFMDQKRVTAWFRKYFDIMGIPYTERRSTTDIFILYPNRSDYN